VQRLGGDRQHGRLGALTLVDGRQMDGDPAAAIDQPRATGGTLDESGDQSGEAGVVQAQRHAAAMGEPTVGAFERPVPADGGLPAFDALGDPEGADRRPAQEGVTLAQRVPQAVVDRVDAESSCDLVDLRLHGEVDLRGADPAVGTRRHMVGEDRRAGELQMGGVVQGRPFPDHAVHHDIAESGRTRVEQDVGGSGEQVSVRVDGGGQPDPSGMAGHGRGHALLGAQEQPDRPTHVTRQ
jgi:hypothetical protein